MIFLFVFIILVTDLYKKILQARIIIFTRYINFKHTSYLLFFRSGFLRFIYSSFPGSWNLDSPFEE